jgi:Eukaryotic cytochrome b561.
MLFAVAAARFFKAKKWWLKTHKALNYVALGSVLVGSALGVAMTQLKGEAAAGAPHRAVGVIAAVGALLLALIGLSIFKQKGKDAVASRKKLHRWAGRLEALLMPTAVALGLLLLGSL